MANRILLPLYEKLYNKKFDYSNFDQRMEMQKAIYLLQDMGVPVGDYGFRWYIHGPYSQELHDDMHFENGRSFTAIVLAEEYTKCIEKLYEVIISSERGIYSISHWVECLASLHYLKSNILSFDATNERAVEELEKRKTHLNERSINLKACKLVEELFA